MLYVIVNGQPRRVLWTIPHPSGDRYALLPRRGEPDTVSVAEIERTPWRRVIKQPAPLHKMWEPGDTPVPA